MRSDVRIPRHHILLLSSGAGRILGGICLQGRGEAAVSERGPHVHLTLGRPAPTPLVSDTPSFKITSKITLSTLYAFPIGQKVVSR